MKVEHNDNNLERLSTLISQAEYWDRTFMFEGHVYIVIERGDSRHTTFSWSCGTVPVFNIKSRTIRALSSSTLVTPLNGVAHTEPLKWERP